MTCVSASMASSWMWKFTRLLGRSWGDVGKDHVGVVAGIAAARAGSPARRGLGLLGYGGRLCLVHLLLHDLALALRGELDRLLSGKVCLARLARKRGELGQPNVRLRGGLIDGDDLRRRGGPLPLTLRLLQPLDAVVAEAPLLVAVRGGELVVAAHQRDQGGLVVRVRPQRLLRLLDA